MAEPTNNSGASGGNKNSIILTLAVVLIVSAWGMFARIVFHRKPEPKPNLHHVTLHWKAVKPIPGVTAVTYNVYRGETSGGTHMKIASGITGLTYDDANAESGKIYSYVVTAMDQRGLESRFSSEVQAVIP